MAADHFVQIQPLDGTLSAKLAPVRKDFVAAGPGKTCGIDVGSTTCKFVMVSQDGQLLAQSYERHNTKQAEKVLDFLTRLETDYKLTPEQDRIFFTGSGAGIIAPLVGGKDDSGSCGRCGRGGKASPVRALRQRNWRRRHEDDFLQRHRHEQEQASADAGCLLGRHGNVHRKDGPQAGNSDRNQLAKMRYTGYTLHKSEQQVRHLRGSGLPTRC